MAPRVGMGICHWRITGPGVGTAESIVRIATSTCAVLKSLITDVKTSATLSASFKVKAVAELDSIRHRVDVMSGKFPLVVVFSSKFFEGRRIYNKSRHQMTLVLRVNGQNSQSSDTNESICCTI